MGIRPTDLAVGIRRDLDLVGEVFLVEPIGPISYVDVDVAGLAVKGVCEPDDAPAPGSRVSLGCLGHPRAPVRPATRACGYSDLRRPCDA